MVLSNIEDRLTYHIRKCLDESQLDWDTLHLASFIISLLACIPSGFITQISLYSDTWRQHLHYTSMEINTFSIAVNFGGYIAPPFLGLICDSHGPVLLTWISFIGFVPTYAYLAWVFISGEPHFASSVFCFALIGISTSALYFASLFTCLKLYPDHQLLSISLPTTFYGLASVIGTQALKLQWFNNGLPYLDLSRVFGFLVLCYTAVSFFTWVSSSFTSMLKLKAGESITVNSASSDNHSNHDENDPRQPLLSPKVQCKLQTFFHDPYVYIMSFIVMASLGPLEMFLTNMGSLADLVHHPSVLSSYSVMSTASRLLSGVMLDFCTYYDIPKIIVLWLALLSGTVGQWLVLPALKSPQASSPFIWSSILSGICCGSLFTVLPIITICIWGESIFGTAYGFFMCAPAVGSTIFSTLYATIFDKNCTTAGTKLPDPMCVSTALRMSALSLALSLLVSVIAYITCWRQKV
ncbi:Mch1p Ecym_2776 [Eremothecium cymbalariae DBVPG|uniref:Probable transporter MCH1 n=1 Tax=Eremothecium cymbalariae (strain CBS 270.75 / DBVPG 7215 / KCTC 17166 / NRRL Y-17582) TaxID=931890 RepID=G8JQ12_ERECY|nr:Hypothetical protein Ecym_2776 [Eremothecium cymbalariae DBVPG\